MRGTRRNASLARWSPRASRLRKRDALGYLGPRHTSTPLVLFGPPSVPASGTPSLHLLSGHKNQRLAEPPCAAAFLAAGRALRSRAQRRGEGQRSRHTAAPGASRARRGREGTGRAAVWEGNARRSPPRPPGGSSRPAPRRAPRPAPPRSRL